MHIICFKLTFQYLIPHQTNHCIAVYHYSSTSFPTQQLAQTPKLVFFFFGLHFVTLTFWETILAEIH